NHAGDFARQRQVPETNTAQLEFSNVAARAPAAETTIPVTAPQLRRFCGLRQREPLISCNFGGGSHRDSYAFPAPVKGMPRCFSRARPSASVLAVVVMQ